MLRASSWTKLEAFLLTARDLGPTTTQDVLRKLRHMEHAGVRLDRGPARSSYRAFIATKKQAGCGPAGIRHYVVAVRHVLAWRGRTWPELHLPREPHPPRTLMADNVLRDVLEYDQDDTDLVAATARAIFRAIFTWTLRPPSEVYALRVRDLDVAHHRLRVWMPKLDTHETTILKPWETDVGRDYLDDVRVRVLESTRSFRRGPASDAFFLDPHTGRPFASVAAMGMFLRRHIKRVSRSAIPYDLRVAGASWLYAQTRDLDFVSRRLRHSSTKSTLWYLRAFRELERHQLHEIRPFDGHMLQGSRASA